MQRIFVTPVIALAVVSLLAADKPTRFIQGSVVQYVDGDTITVLDDAKEKHKVRLAGIDAPEVDRGKNEPGQPFGTKAKQELERLVGQYAVFITWTEKDKDGRVLGDVAVGDKWINLDMVRAGFAWHDSRLDKRKELADAEKEAREAKRGLWADKSPVPPWEWRKKERGEKAE